MKYRLHTYSLLKFILTIGCTLFFALNSFSIVLGISKYDPFEVSNSPNNIAEQFPDKLDKLTVDMWDYAQCDENCEKWISQSQLTCGNSLIMNAFVEGDKTILDQSDIPEVSGDGDVNRNISSISNYAHDACTQAQLAENEAKLTADWPRQNTRYNGQIGLSSVCEGAASATSYTPNACAAYGTNMGNFAYEISSIGKIAANRPVVVLFDISSQSPPPSAYLNAAPLILRIVNVSHATNIDTMRERGSFFGDMFAGKNVILVLGNEPNNPELEKNGGLVNYCEGIDIPSCGAKYVNQFKAFYTGVGGRVDVAAAPLDLLNAQYPASNFYNTAREAYVQADVLAANIYCSDNVSACINGNQGFGFYGIAKQDKIITEFGPNPPNVSVAEQAQFIEDNCASATSATRIVAPLIVNNCTSQTGDWLYYVDGLLFDQKGAPQTATCSVDNNSVDKQKLGSLYDFFQGSAQDKRYTPVQQATWAFKRCAGDIIRTAEEGAAYCAINPQCTNASNICVEDGDCRSNYLVCKDFVRAMGGGTKITTNQLEIAKRWAEMSDTLKKEVNLITETKANVRGFLVTARDLEFTTKKCRWGFLCKDAELPLEIAEIMLPGVEGAANSSAADLQDTTLPKTYNQIRGGIIRDAGKIYEPICPNNCELIPYEACENLDEQYIGKPDGRGDVFTKEHVDFYKRLVNRICSAPEQLACDEGAAVSTHQTTGSKVNARPNTSFLQNLYFKIKNLGKGIEVPQDQPTTRMWLIADEATYNLGAFAQAYLNGYSMPKQTQSTKDSSLYTSEYIGSADAESNAVQRVKTIPCSTTDPDCPSGYRTVVEEASVKFKERHPPKIDAKGANKTDEFYNTGGTRNGQIPLSWTGDRSNLNGPISWGEVVACKLPRVAAILGITPQGCGSITTTNPKQEGINQLACIAKQHLFQPSCSGKLCYEEIIARSINQTSCNGKVLNPYYAIAIALNENGGLIATDESGTNVKHFGCDPFEQTQYSTTVEGKLTCMLNTLNSYCNSGKTQAEALSTYGYSPSNKLDSLIGKLEGSDTTLFIEKDIAQVYAQSLRTHLSSNYGQDLWRRYYEPVIQDYQNNCSQ